MRILLNGERRDLPGPRTVRSLLEDLGIDARMVAVEMNRTIIRRDRHSDTPIPDGAEVEIVSFVGGGEPPGRVSSSDRAGRKRNTVWTALLVLALSGASLTGRSAGPSQQGDAQAPPVLTEETFLIYSGWAALAAGDTQKASALAGQVLSKYPRSSAALSLLVESEIVRGGGLAGLNVYERWLGSRKLEDAYIARRAARAILWGDTTKPEVAVEALQHLAADDDAEARAQLVRRMVAGSLADTRALARIGDEGAVRRLIDNVEKAPGGKMYQIQALVESKSPLAIPPLTKLLSDKNHPDHIAAAADGLGTLGASAAIPQLRRLYQDSSSTLAVRYMAAVGLYKMNDLTGLPLLRQQLTAEDPNLRVGAARYMAGQAGGAQPDGTWQTVVKGLAGEKDPAVRAQAAELLAPFDLDFSRQVLEQLLTDANGAIRELAGLAMVKRVVTDFATLRRLMRSPDVQIQVAASGRLLELTR